MRIVIIDSGLALQLQKESYVSACYQLSRKDDETVIETGCEDVIGHGTGIYGIIRNGLADPDTEIVIVKVTESEEEVVNEQVLIDAMCFVRDTLRPDIVNLSLCVRAAQHQAEMYSICKELTENQTVLVAAFDNGGAVSYPAAFDCVVGVTSEPSITSSDRFVPVQNTYVNVLAKGRVQRLLWKDGKPIIGWGDSLATAHFTRILSNQCYHSQCTPQEALKQLGVYMQPAETQQKQLPDWVAAPLRAAVFPYNKEMHSVVRYSEMMHFQLQDIYDVRRSGKVGKSITTSLGAQYQIKNIAQIDYDEIDVLIVGHLAELSMIDQSFSAVELILDALAHGRKVYSLDTYNHPKIREFAQQGDFFSPQIQIDPAELVPMGKLFINSVPVVGVFGTRSRQGKFTLQMELRSRLLADHYCVAQLGTEPTACLFGMDACYHFGYNGNRALHSESQKLAYINLLLHRMEQGNPDIMLSGSQSQTITSTIGNIGGFALDQYTFLLGLQPDIVILAVCYEDTPSYISATVRFLESAVDCRVIGAVLFPFKLVADHKTDTLISDSEYEEFCVNLRNHCPHLLPVYRLEKQTDLDALYQRMIDSFCE